MYGSVAITATISASNTCPNCGWVHGLFWHSSASRNHTMTIEQVPRAPRPTAKQVAYELDLLTECGKDRACAPPIVNWYVERTRQRIANEEAEESQ